MSWLRIDDGFAQHPKLEGWTSAQKWALIELFLYCAKHKTCGYVPSDLALLPRAVTKPLLLKAEECGLLDRESDGRMTIHDWNTYNPADPTASERMQRWRERNPDASALSGSRWKKTRVKVFERDEGYCVDCHQFDEHWNADHEPPRKKLVEQGLDIYDIQYIQTRCHSCHAKKTRRESSKRAVTEPVTNGVTEEYPRAPASRPVPSPSVKSSTSYVEPARAIERLLNILPDADPQTATTVRSLCRRHRLAEGDVEWARECATGPGVNFPSRVAVGELVKRGEAKAAA